MTILIRSTNINILKKHVGHRLSLMSIWKYSRGGDRAYRSHIGGATYTRARGAISEEPHIPEQEEPYQRSHIYQSKRSHIEGFLHVRTSIGAIMLKEYCIGGRDCGGIVFKHRNPSKADKPLNGTLGGREFLLRLVQTHIGSKTNIASKKWSLS